jgi:hypothetical protein
MRRRNRDTALHWRLCLSRHFDHHILCARSFDEHFTSPVGRPIESTGRMVARQAVPAISTGRHEMNLRDLNGDDFRLTRRVAETVPTL